MTTDETRLIELFESGMILAELARELNISKTSAFNWKQRLTEAGKLHQGGPDTPEPSLEDRAATALERFQKAASAYDKAMDRCSRLPREIELAKSGLAEQATGFYMGQISSSELEDAEDHLRFLETELRTAQLALPLLAEHREYARRQAEVAQRLALEDRKSTQFTELRDRFRERGVPLSCADERELRSLAVGQQKYAVDRLMRELDDEERRRAYGR
jgi:hypothetical protein